jgi:hypothetical protein
MGVSHSRRLVIVIFFAVFFASVFGADRPSYSEWLIDAEHFSIRENWFAVLSAPWLTSPGLTLAVFVVGIGLGVVSRPLLRFRAMHLGVGLVVAQIAAMAVHFGASLASGLVDGPYAGGLVWLTGALGMVLGGSRDPSLSAFGYPLGPTLAWLLGFLAGSLTLGYFGAGVAGSLANAAAFGVAVLLGRFFGGSSREREVKVATKKRPTHLKVVHRAEDMLN